MNEPISRSLKRKQKREEKQRAQNANRFYVYGIVAIVVLILGAVILQSSNPRNINIPHIHGLGFSPDGSQLIVPAHDGLRIYSEGGWQIPENVPVRDYMGYSAVDIGFYSSGHPGSTGEINPLGLVSSGDLGVSLEKLGFEGESDFHIMAAGFYNHVIYVVNPSPNSGLATGLFYTLDDGQSWTQADAIGLTQQPYAMAAHPTEANIVAMATEAGLFFSDDFGSNFALIWAEDPVTAVVFLPSGELFFGSDSIWTLDNASGEIAAFNGPNLDNGDVVLYMTGSPSDPNRIALASAGLDIFITTDGGVTWLQIANDGVPQEG